MTLDYCAGEWRSSLRLEVQTSWYLYLSYDVHRPWNIVERYGSDDKWENEVSEEMLPLEISVCQREKKSRIVSEEKKVYHMVYR